MAKLSVWNTDLSEDIDLYVRYEKRVDGGYHLFVGPARAGWVEKIDGKWRACLANSEDYLGKPENWWKVRRVVETATTRESAAADLAWEASRGYGAVREHVDQIVKSLRESRSAARDAREAAARTRAADAML